MLPMRLEAPVGKLTGASAPAMASAWAICAASSRSRRPAAAAAP